MDKQILQTLAGLHRKYAINQKKAYCYSASLTPWAILTGIHCNLCHKIQYLLTLKKTRFAFHWDCRGSHKCSLLLIIRPISDHVGWRNLFKSWEFSWVTPGTKGWKLLLTGAILPYTHWRTHQNRFIDPAHFKLFSHKQENTQKTRAKVSSFSGKEMLKCGKQTLVVIHLQSLNFSTKGAACHRKPCDSPVTFSKAY